MLDKLVAILLAMALTFTGTPLDSETVCVGSRVTFGGWHQTRYVDEKNNTVFPFEPIVWTVLDIEDNNALIVTEKAIDAQPYNETYAEVVWESCTLRTWLNGEFLNEAFSERERRHIRLTEVENGPESTVYSLDQGPDTSDYIFILSPGEIKKYYPKWDYRNQNSKPRAIPTTYAAAQGGPREGNNYNARFWVRSTGASTAGNAAMISGWGELMGRPVHEKGCVCPALWVDVRALDLFKDENTAKTSWTSWISEAKSKATVQDSSKNEEGIVATVTAKTVCIRDASGNPLEYLGTDSRLTVTGYNDSLESFSVIYKGKEGYIKGIGLNYSADELISMLEK